MIGLHLRPHLLDVDVDTDHVGPYSPGAPDRVDVPTNHGEHSPGASADRDRKYWSGCGATHQYFFKYVRFPAPYTAGVLFPKICGLRAPGSPILRLT